jgi:hypothetical protein
VAVDGAEWHQRIVTAPFLPRYGHGVLVFADRLWILGGSGKEGHELADIWSSSDGTHQRRLVGPRTGDLWALQAM